VQDKVHNTQQPRVVALIPAFNAGSFLKQSVASLLDQVTDRPRIIVIDDASSDKSLNDLLEWEAAGKIEIRRNQRNQGKAESLNQAFAEIEADFFIIQDADDVAKPDRVTRQLAFMQADSAIGCSSSFVDYVNSAGDYVAAGKLDILDDAKQREYLAGDEPFGLYCPAVILRAEVVKNPDLRFRGQFWPADDIDLWNRIAEAGYKVRAQPEYLVSYRVHGKSVVTSGFAKTRMQYEWLRSCLRARRAKLPEPNREEFLQTWNSASWWKRMNRSRKFYAKGCYRAAGFAVAEKKYIVAASRGLMAIMLQPTYALRRAMSQLQNRLR
jgi:glycosyltransferase involved in cell wall biosynthesis